MVLLWAIIGQTTSSSVQCVIWSSTRWILHQFQFYNMVNFTVYFAAIAAVVAAASPSPSPTQHEWMNEWMGGWMGRNECVFGCIVFGVVIWNRIWLLASTQIHTRYMFVFHILHRTLVMGYGTAPPEHLSMFVIIVACIGMGIPLLLLIAGGVYVFVKRARNRWTHTYTRVDEWIWICAYHGSTLLHTD